MTPDLCVSYYGSWCEKQRPKPDMRNRAERFYTVILELRHRPDFL